MMGMLPRQSVTDPMSNIQGSISSVVDFNSVEILERVYLIPLFNLIRYIYHGGTTGTLNETETSSPSSAVTLI